MFLSPWNHLLLILHWSKYWILIWYFNQVIMNGFLISLLELSLMSYFLVYNQGWYIISLFFFPLIMFFSFYVLNCISQAKIGSFFYWASFIFSNMLIIQLFVDLIMSVKWIQYGDKIATASDDGTVKVFDYISGKLL